MGSKRGKEYSVPSFHSPLPEKDLCLRLWVKQPRNEDIWARRKLGGWPVEPESFVASPFGKHQCS